MAANTDIGYFYGGDKLEIKSFPPNTGFVTELNRQTVLDSYAAFVSRVDTFKVVFFHLEVYQIEDVDY